MREVKHLSYTSYTLFRRRPEEFFIRYLADQRPEGNPQTQPMAAGSAFDAFVKAHMYKELIGKKEPKFELETLFNSQVEIQNRDEAWIVGKNLFDKYKTSGALEHLMVQLRSSLVEPKFEVEIKENIEGVPLLGRPDVFFINKEGAHVILDFKVNGYYSARQTNPARGYVTLYEGRTKLPAHKDAFPTKWKGIIINGGDYFETINKGWAEQETIYAWLCGVKIGEEFLSAIDQLIHQENVLRVAQHRARVSHNFQCSFIEDIKDAWATISSDHFFRDVSKEESIERCEQLNKIAEVLSGDPHFAQMSRI